MLGYWGEPYLRFNADGTVEENVGRRPCREREPLRRVVGDESGRHADAESQWAQVASDGSYAWHDHRAHWMSPSRRPGERGTEVLTGVDALEVDGTDVQVSVAVSGSRSRRVFWSVAGAIGAGFAVLIALSARHRVAWVLVVTGAVAAGIGWWQVVPCRRRQDRRRSPGCCRRSPPASAVVAVTLGRSLVSHALVVVVRNATRPVGVPAPRRLDQGVAADGRPVLARSWRHGCGGGRRHCRRHRRRARDGPPARRRGLTPWRKSCPLISSRPYRECRE